MKIEEQLSKKEKFSKSMRKVLEKRSRKFSKPLMMTGSRVTVLVEPD